MEFNGAQNWYLICHAPGSPACLQFVDKYPNHASTAGKYCKFHGGDRVIENNQGAINEDCVVDGDEKLGKDGSDIVAATEKWFANLEKTLKKKKSE